MSTDRAAETAEGQRTRPGRKQGATGEFTTSWKVEAQAARLEKDGAAAPSAALDMATPSAAPASQVTRGRRSRSIRTASPG
jgi:hypothetical protein